MKIIALLPVKNEAWALSSYLSSISRVADQVIALDDGSSDNSVEILKRANVAVHHFDSSKESIVNMSTRRQRLLELGRAAGGTHFIWLDADETFSADFLPLARKKIIQLEQGEKLSMRWVHAWKDTEHYLNDSRSPFGRTWKDVVVCDDGSNFLDQFLSEPRTQGNRPATKLDEEKGVVLHWQFARWEITQYKQALYRCLELLKGERSARRINHTYSITLDQPGLKTETIPEKWLAEIELPDTSSHESTFTFKAQIEELFTVHGIKTFEPLQVWHISALREYFKKEVGREPIPQTYAMWLITLNGLRHKIKSLTNVM